MLIIEGINNRNDLFTMMKKAVTEVLQTLNATALEPNAQTQEWITTPVLKLYLKEKGYHANSSITIKKIVTSFNIRTEKRGRDLWFKIVDITSIPSKL